MAKEDWGPEEVALILDKVAEKIPALLKGLREVVYSVEAGEQFGKAVGAFYSELVKQGIPQEQAMEMAKNYMISLRDLAKPSLKLGEKEIEKELKKES
jgi:hypothetical protein